MKLFCILLCLAPVWGVAQQPQEPLPAPDHLRVISPEPLQNISSQPQQTTPYEWLEFQWEAVPKAVAYAIEIDCYGCCSRKHWCSDDKHKTFTTWMIKGSRYRYSLVPGRFGSWRIWAIDNTGQSGQVSPWSVFSVPVDSNAVVPSRPKRDALPRALPFPIVMASAHPVDPITGEACDSPSTQAKGSGITQPKGIYTPTPEYGDSSRRSGVNGTARVVAHVEADGMVHRACLLDAVQPDLGEESVRTIRLWRFEPARKDGTPIPYIVEIETDFTLYPWTTR